MAALGGDERGELRGLPRLERGEDETVAEVEGEHPMFLPNVT